MNKQQLVDGVALKGEMTKKDSEKAIVAVFEAITEALARDEKVQLVGFGTFSVKDRAARIGHNPQSGESINILACQVPHFKAGKQLKSSVKGV